MIDGKPIIHHLLEDSTKTVVELSSQDYGKFAERVGSRTLRFLRVNTDLVQSYFPDINILSTKKINGQGDYTIEVHYSLGDGEHYGKKILLFEIKHGNIVISAPQLRKYSTMLFEPGKYFKKADEVKVVYMIFEKINTMGNDATYRFCELKPELARKILNDEEDDEK